MTLGGALFRVCTLHQGFMCPAYMSSNKFGDRSEVFSFGVTMLEIITGKRNQDVDGGLYCYFIVEEKEELVPDVRAGDWCERSLPL